ncbi:MAG: hypothetical protein ABIR15_21890 [Chitinophagaceae bacterium]
MFEFRGMRYMSKWMIVLFLLVLALVILNLKTLFDNGRYADINTALSLQNDSIATVNIYLTNEIKKAKQPCIITGSLTAAEYHIKKSQ